MMAQTSKTGGSGLSRSAAAGVIAASAVPEAVGIGALAGAAFGSVNEVLKKHGVDDDAES